MKAKTLCAAVLALTSCIPTSPLEVRPQISVVYIPESDVVSEPLSTSREQDSLPYEAKGKEIIVAEPLKFNRKAKNIKKGKTLQYLVLNEEQYEMLVFDLELISNENSVYWDLTCWFQCPNLIKMSNKNEFNCWAMDPEESSAREMVRKTANLISKYHRDKKITIDQDYLTGFRNLMNDQNYLDSWFWGTETTIKFIE